MPLPDDTCLQLSIDLSQFLDLSITLPGGVSLDAKLEPNELPTLSGIVQSVLGPLNAAMTPLMPFFRLLDVVIKIVDFCTAVIDALGPPPDPTLLVKRLNALLKAFAKVLGLIPPLSLPIMIVGVCKTISAGLLALILELEDVISIQFSLSAKEARVEALMEDEELLEGAALLRASMDCAQADLDLQAEIGSSGLGPLNKFLDLLNAFIGLIGLDPLGKVEPGSANPAEMLEPLRKTVEILATVCGSIPV